MIHSEQVKQRGVEVIDMDGIFHRSPPQLVSFADNLTALCAAARHPQTEGVRMMIAARFLPFPFVSISKRRTTELAAENNERRRWSWQKTGSSGIFVAQNQSPS